MMIQEEENMRKKKQYRDVKSRDEFKKIQKMKNIFKDNMTFEPQVGFTMQHEMGSETKNALVELINEVKKITEGFSGDVTDLGNNLNNSILKAVNIFDETFGLIRNIIWVVPVIVGLWFAWKTNSRFGKSITCTSLVFVLSMVIPKDVWNKIKDCVVNLFSEDEFYDAREFQAGAGFVDASQLAGVMSILLTYMTIGDTDPFNMAGTFMKKMATFGRDVDGWSKLISFVVGLIEKYIDYIRNYFTGSTDKPAPFTILKSGVGVVDEWCKKVMHYVTLSNTGGDVLTPDVVADISALRREGEGLTNTYRFDKNTSAILHKYLKFLEDLCKLCASAMHSFKGGRAQPVVLALTGKPGVGKTFLCKHITGYVLAKTMDIGRLEELNFDVDSEVFQKGSTEYWNGYAGQACVIMDDWGQSVPSPGVENDFIDLIRMANCWSYPLNFADLENKGKNFFRSDFILLTTNIANLNSAQKVIVEPEAVSRRIDFGFDVEVAPEFSLDGKLDMNKVQDYITEKGEVPYHAWVLRKHLFRVGAEARTLYDREYSLSEILDSVANTIKRNKDIHKYNSDVVKTCVKKIAYERQAGIFNMWKTQKEEFFALPVNMKERFVSLCNEWTQHKQSLENFVMSVPNKPIVQFLLSGAASFLLILIVKKIFDVVRGFFSKEDKVKFTSNSKRMLNSQFNEKDMQYIMAFLKPSDFEEAYEDEEGNFSIRRRINAAGFERALARAKSKQFQSNEPNNARMPYRKVIGSRVLDSDKPIEITEDFKPQVDSYGYGIANVAAGNMYRMFVENDRGVLNFGHILFISGDCAVFPEHFIRHMQNNLDMSNISVDDNIQLVNAVNPHLNVTYTIKKFLNCPRVINSERDVCFMSFKTLRAHRDLIKFFMVESDLTSLSKVRVRLDTVEGVDNFVYRSRSVDAQRKDILEVVDNGQTYRIADSFEYVAHTKSGDCGGLACLEEGAQYQVRRILGIHIAGVPSLGLGVCNILTQEFVKQNLNQLGVIVDETDFTKFQASGGMIEGTFMNLGKTGQKHNLCPNTSLYKTKLSDKWGKLDKKPAHLKPFIKDGVRINPMEKALEGYATKVMTFDDEMLDLASYVAFKKIRDLTRTHTRKIYSFEEAVAGSVEDDFKGIPRNTSPGYPWVLEGHTNKKSFFGSDGDYLFDSQLSQDVKAKVYDVLRKASQGIRCEHVFMDFLKDELRKPEKADAGKTRLISSAPLVYTIAWRMMFLAFTNAVTKTRIRNGIAVGINPYTEWDFLYKQMITKGKKCVAGDFKGFDSSEQPEIHWAILKNINAWYDDGEENARIREVLWTEVVNSKHFGGLDGNCDNMYVWNKSLPSGHPATSVINSCYNLIAFNMVWIDIMGVFMAPKFWEHVYICVYGDDNILNISDEVVGQFNQSSISVSMAKFGLTYTMEDKSDEVIPYRSVDHIEFLKRRFRRESLSGTVVGPQQLDSILYIPYWSKNKKLEREIMEANLEHVLMELSLHGDEEWNTYSKPIVEVYKHELEYDPCLPVKRQYYLRRSQEVVLPWM